MLGIGLVLIACSLVLYYSMKNILVQTYDRALLEKIHVLTSFADGVSFEFTDWRLSEFEPGPAAEYYQIWLSTGELIAKSPSLGTEELPFPETKSPTFRDLALPDGRAGRALLRSVGDDDDFRLTLARSRTDLDRTFRRVLVGNVLAILTVLGLVWIVTLFAVRLGLNRLNRLEDEARSLDVDEKQSRFTQEPGVRELEPIVSQLNHLLDRMHSAMERERRFSSHAAHELLTPIAEMRALGDVELAINPDSPLAKDAVAIAKQMEELVSTLLQLARSQGGAPLPQDDEVGFTDLLEEIWSPFREAANQRALDCQLAWKTPLRIRTNRAALRTIIENLLKNAVAYTPRQGTICSKLTGTADGWKLVVTNTDTTLTEADLEHLFDPLWRKDTARTSSHHSGLGLPLAKSLSEQLNLSLKANVSRENGFEIWVHC